MTTKRAPLEARVDMLEGAVRALVRRLERAEADGATTRAILTAVATRTGEEFAAQRERGDVTIRALSHVTAAVQALVSVEDVEDVGTVH